MALSWMPVHWPNINADHGNMRCFVCVLLAVQAVAALSQGLSYLKDIPLKKKPDFITNEVNVIKAVDYLLSHPISQDDPDRSACFSFVYRYADKSPFIVVNLRSPVSKALGYDPDLLLLFTGLWVKSALQQRDRPEGFHEEYAIGQLYPYCKAGNGIASTPSIQALIAAGDKGELDKWIHGLN